MAGWNHSGLDDVEMMRQAIQHGGGHPGVAKHLRDLAENQTPVSRSG